MLENWTGIIRRQMRQARIKDQETSNFHCIARLKLAFGVSTWR
jgi:hypothetical protein